MLPLILISLYCYLCPVVQAQHTSLQFEDITDSPHRARTEHIFHFALQAISRISHWSTTDEKRL